MRLPTRATKECGEEVREAKQCGGELRETIECGQVDTELDTRRVNTGASKVKVCDSVALFPTPVAFSILGTRLSVTLI